MKVYATINGIRTETFKPQQYFDRVDLSKAVSMVGSKKKISFNRMLGKLHEVIKPTVKKYAHVLRADLKQAWPVKTGASRDGWRIQANQYDWTVVNTVVNPLTRQSYIDDLWLGKSEQMPFGAAPDIVRRVVGEMKMEISMGLRNV